MVLNPFSNYLTSDVILLFILQGRYSEKHLPNGDILTKICLVSSEIAEIMSLYDDLGVETSDTKTEGWSKNFKLLQSQLQVKKAANTQAKVWCRVISLPTHHCYSSLNSISPAFVAFRMYNLCHKYTIL